MNRNLHSPTKLTEFARDFDIEPDTFLAKFVNKITNVYNSGYNTVNVVPSTSSPVLTVGQLPVSHGPSPNSTPSHSSNASQSSSSTSEQLAQQLSATASGERKKDVVGDADKLGDLPRSNARTPSSVLQRISNLMAIRNNVKLIFIVYH